MLRKRLVSGLLAGGLMIGLLPGVASAAKPSTFGACVAGGTVGTHNETGFGFTVGNAGPGIAAGPWAIATVSDAGGQGQPPNQPLSAHFTC